MSETSLSGPGGRAERPSLLAWTTRLAASPAFQSWASRVPVLRRIARSEGEALFDLVAGFLHSQILQALVSLGVLDQLTAGPLRTAELARRTGVPEPRMAVLLRAGVALKLLRFTRGGRIALSRRGAAFLGVPGLRDMVLHHDVLYRDMADPAAFFRGETEPELARFWPYVFGAGTTVDPGAAERYSALMADSQALVAEETLRAVSFAGTAHLLDVGGGTGAFLAAVARATPGLHGTLFDLPAVVPAARERFAAAGLSDRIDVVPGSFRTDRLPAGADTVSLVRVLYDHADDTVAALLRKLCEALPPGGRLVVSEPMTGGARPHPAGDVYFALYCMAMGTGRARSAAEISALLAGAGFREIRTVATYRPFVTGVVSAVKPG